MMVSSGSVPEILSPNIAKKTWKLTGPLPQPAFRRRFCRQVDVQGKRRYLSIFLVNEAISVGIHHTEGFFEFLDL